MRLHISLAVFGLLTLQASAWNFAPQAASTFVDGGVQRHYYLVADSRKIHFRTDGQTRVSGSGAATEFTFTNLSYGVVTLSQSPLNEKRPPFDKELPLYRAAAEKLLPEGATEIVMVSEDADVYPINDWTSYRYTWKYVFFGRPLQTGITFLNYNPKEQWVIQVSATPAEFEAANARVSRLLNTFNETDVSFSLETAPN